MCEYFYFIFVSVFVLDVVVMLLTSDGECADLCVVIIAIVIALVIISFMSCLSLACKLHELSGFFWGFFGIILYDFRHSYFIYHADKVSYNHSSD